jgi:hypothetical protein
MLKNKENVQCEPRGDRFIPTEIRPCAFQVEYARPTRESAGSSYEQLLNKGILEEIDLKSNHKIMSFAEKGLGEGGKRTGKGELAKSFARVEPYP